MDEPTKTTGLLPVVYKLPTWSQCDAKAASAPFKMTALEEFIHQNEPAGSDDQLWRQHLADVLAETVNEDREGRGA